MFFFVTLHLKIIAKDMEQNINRIKVVLAEKNKTNKWLSEQIGKDPATVSKWCTNSMQPCLETLVEIANALEVDVKELLNPSRDDVAYIKIPLEKKQVTVKSN